MHKIADSENMYCAFPTTILKKHTGHEHKGRLNTELMKVIDSIDYQNSASKIGSWNGDTSSYGSTQSPLEMFFSRKDECVTEIKKEIDEAITEFLATELKSVEDLMKRSANRLNHHIEDVNYTYYGWTVRMGPHDENTLHMHPKTVYSGVYYVNVPDDLPFPEGCLQLANPHLVSTAFESGHPPGDFVRMNSGDMIIFPAWLAHSVMPYRSSDESRYCIVFNVIVEKLWSIKNEN